MSNDHVDASFLPALDAIFGSPRKVAAELRDHERLVELAEAQHVIFDEWDEAIMHDVVGCKRLQKPIQNLLISRSQIKTTLGSFGISDAEKVLRLLLPELDKLYEACAEEWNDQ